MSDICRHAGQVIDCTLAFPDYGYSSAQPYLEAASQVIYQTEKEYNMPSLTIIALLIVAVLVLDVYCRQAGIE